MSGLTFSIIIPVCNYGRWVAQAIESVMSQGGDDFEVLVVDDGSTDDTPQVVAGYVPRVRCVHQQNQGVYAACSRGLDETTGPFVIFLDADDRLVPGALARDRGVLAERPDMKMIFGSHVSVMPDGQRREKRFEPLGPPLENFRRFVHGRLHSLSAGGAVLHRDALEPLRRANPPFFHGLDVVVIAQGLARFPSCRIDRPLAEIYVHGGWLRHNIESIGQAGLQAAEVLFDPRLLPPEAMRYRSAFVGWLERSRARAFYRAGRYGLSARCYLSAVRAFILF
jgi:glycosyltransferase involved in cell wall biosynthesis